jgi:hypothetical protein
MSYSIILYIYIYVYYYMTKDMIGFGRAATDEATSAAEGHGTNGETYATERNITRRNITKYDAMQ